ncbi:F0F1 ATP synthase subunit delta [Nakamurella sp. YIM 132087]|uniref:ATP synthase subunit delta n=1 Tax=Nakamurella alba TaxID=2665158 RepID=A0A7K1FJN7_9ACTN|nr:F0F1 ATP synthase subunit delta [Nakamurella alba]MTD13649.1 F0F1 ATP synthase subunit delta [Nakamurella alba]
MQHISSRQALDEATNRLLTQAATLDDTGLGAFGDDLLAVGGLLQREPALRRTLSEATTGADTRAGIMSRILQGKVGQPALALVDFAIRLHWANGRDLKEGVERLGRTAVFLRAERNGDLDDVEDQLFRFGRIADANPGLSVLLDDPTTPGDARAELVRRVIGGRVLPLTEQLLLGLAQDPGGRSFSFGVRELVDQAAARRDRVVAVVTSAVELTTEESNRLVAGLGKVYGRPVVVHSEVDASLGGGVRVRVGDEVIDGSISGRLAELRRRLAR